jgi:hypothetical protein
MLMLLGRSHVDDKAMVHVAIHIRSLALIDLLDRNDLDVRDNPMVAADVARRAFAGTLIFTRCRVRTTIPNW